MKKKKNLDFTEGASLGLLIAFTWPNLMSNLLNQVYSITDSIVVGRVLGSTALAAVGVCMPIVLLVSSMVIGLNVGVGIIMSQCFGKKDLDEMRHSFANSIYLGIILGVVLAFVGVAFTEPILRLIGTPDGPFREAAQYMKITFIATVLPIFYFMLSNVFRGIGDSYTALYCLIVSVVSNVFLDYLFVAVFHMGVAGTAYATALAQAMAVVFAFLMLYIKYPELRLKKEDFRVDFGLFRRITVLAVPIAIQSGFNNLGNVVVQSCINGFGETIMAAYTVASRIGTLSLMPAETIASSLSVYAGQNYGAKKLSRIRDGVRSTHIINAAVSAALGILILFLGKPMVGLFVANPGEEMLSATYRYLLFAAVPGILYGIMHIYQQVLRGVNRANDSLIGSLMQLAAKVLIALVAAKSLGNLDLVWAAWPISYVVGVIYPYFAYRLFLKKSNAA